MAEKDPPLTENPFAHETVQRRQEILRNIFLQAPDLSTSSPHEVAARSLDTDRFHRSEHRQILSQRLNTLLQTAETTSVGAETIQESFAMVYRYGEKKAVERDELRLGIGIYGLWSIFEEEGAKIFEKQFYQSEKNILDQIKKIAARNPQILTYRRTYEALLTKHARWQQEYAKKFGESIEIEEKR